jgi:hypothetical protein
MYRYSFVIVFALILLRSGPVWPVEHVTFKYEGKPRLVSGKVLKEEGGAVLLLAADGVIHNLASDEVLERTKDAEPFKPLAREELAKKLAAELPPGTKVHHTAHYLICYNTSLPYAKWVGTQYEELYKAFQDHFRKLAWELPDPEFPLVALVFDDKASYAEFARAEIGDGVDSIVAYYNFQTNRVLMYDLTGVGAAGGPAGVAKVAAFLAAPGAAGNLATIIHEATHQIAFNRGLHQRYADIPIWVSEGLAVYCETPNLKPRLNWVAPGAFSPSRQNAFLAQLEDRPANGLEILLTEDKRFKDPKMALGCYGEAWALNYYLFKNKGKDYIDYLKLLAQKGPGVVDTPQQRLADFKSIFGDDLKKLDDTFVKFMRARK